MYCVWISATVSNVFYLYFWKKHIEIHVYSVTSEGCSDHIRLTITTTTHQKQYFTDDTIKLTLTCGWYVSVQRVVVVGWTAPCDSRTDALSRVAATRNALRFEIIVGLHNVQQIKISRNIHIHMPSRVCKYTHTQTHTTNSEDWRTMIEIAEQHSS